MGSRADVEGLPAFITAIANEDYAVARFFIKAALKAKESEMPNLAIFQTMSCPEQIAAAAAHIVEDIGHSCGDLAILHHEQVLFHGQPADLIKQARGQEVNGREPGSRRFAPVKY